MVGHIGSARRTKQQGIVVADEVETVRRHEGAGVFVALRTPVEMLEGERKATVPPGANRERLDAGADHLATDAVAGDGGNSILTHEPPRDHCRARFGGSLDDWPLYAARPSPVTRSFGSGQTPLAVREAGCYMPLAPRPMAAMPVRDTSSRPSSVMIEMNCSILDVRPVISNTKCSVEASMTLARKISAMRRASMRLSPLPLTFTSASSRSNGSPRAVRSTTRCTFTSLSSWLLICSSTMAVPVVTTVKRERCLACSVSDTVRLSML